MGKLILGKVMCELGHSSCRGICFIVRLKSNGYCDAPSFSTFFSASVAPSSR